MVPGAQIPAMIAAHSAARRKALLQVMRRLPPSTATRERVLAAEPTLAPVLDRMIEEGVVRVRADGTLRVDESSMRAHQAAQGKAALLVGCVVVAVTAGILVALLLVR